AGAWRRREVMPRREQRFPGAAGRLATTAAGLRDVRAALAGQADAVLGAGDLDVRAPAAAPVAVQRFAVARLLRRHGAAVSHELVERALGAARAHAAGAAAGRDPGPWRASLGKDRFLMVGYGRVTVVARSRGRLQAPVTVSDAAELLRALARAGRRGALTAAEAAALLARHGPLALRRRAPGDRVGRPAAARRRARP